jgi:molybdate transport system ATP-binding protein
VSLDASIDVVVGDFELAADVVVEPGDVLAVLGPNGAGKTTLMRTLAGLHPVDAGRIVIDGAVVDDPVENVFVPAEERPVGVVFQDHLLFGHLSALDNVAFGLRATGTPRGEARHRAGAWLDRMGLADHHRARARTLSGGQSQRVALARTLATEPRVLLLDEPLASLDAATRRDVRRELRTHLDGFDGIRVLVTHDPVDAYALADRVAVLVDGRIEQTGTIADVTAHPRSRFVAELVGTNLVAGVVEANELRTDSGVVVSVVTDVRGPCFAVIRPQSIVVALDSGVSSARNVFRGVVDDVDRLGDRARLGVAGPLHLTAEITTATLDELGLRPGDTVTATVKATDIQVYPA